MPASLFNEYQKTVNGTRDAYYGRGDIGYGLPRYDWGTGRVSLVKSSQYVHLGKFDSARDEFLYDMTLEGWANQDTGDSESPTGWFALVIIEPAELSEVWQAFADGTGARAIIEARESAGDLIGNFIITTDSHGFVYAESFESAERARAEYAAREEQYDEWSNEEED